MAHERHVPVLREDVVRVLARPSAVLIDGTVGEGGHAHELLVASGAGSRLLGVDLDRDSLFRARGALGEFRDRVRLVHGTFAQITEIAAREGFPDATGILFDLGMAAHHLDVERGFSFHSSGLLDMRFDASGAVQLPVPQMPALRRLAARRPAYTAADVLSELREDELTELLQVSGGERHARRIAGAVVTARQRAQIRTAPELVQLVVRALPPRARHGRLHAATRTFQALRMAVNRELEALDLGLRGALSLLAPGGRLAVIAFHSGEDRMVKRHFRDAARYEGYTLLTRRPVRPTPSEEHANPRSRSARLRVIEQPPAPTSL